jgi:hypothetical protein
MIRRPLVLNGNTIEQLQAGDSAKIGRLNLGPEVQLPISANAILITTSFHSILSFASASERQLHTINGGDDGDVLVLTGTDAGGSISVRDNTGNLRLAGNNSLSSDADTIVLLKMGTVWIELARSNNG